MIDETKLKNDINDILKNINSSGESYGYSLQAVDGAVSLIILNSKSEIVHKELLSNVGTNAFYAIVIGIFKAFVSGVLSAK